MTTINNIMPIYYKYYLLHYFKKDKLTFLYTPHEKAIGTNLYFYIKIMR